MDQEMLERLRFPIGRQPVVAAFDAEAVRKGIADLVVLPDRIRTKVAGLSEADLERRYRPEGWTVRQVIHHVADSHLNSYARFKLALTEERPTIKPYDEARWAELPDGKSGPIGASLDMLAGIHARLTALLRTLDEAALRRSFWHPESRREIFLFENVAIYSWHGRHHLAHIDLALKG
jgi:DinB superfamily